MLAFISSSLRKYLVEFLLSLLVFLTRPYWAARMWEDYVSVDLRLPSFYDRSLGRG